MRPGELVQLRSPAEILATLDADGTLEGQPFMPEMLEYFGRSFKVSAHAGRACNTITPDGGVFDLKASVYLDDLRCAGSAHGGCQAMCRLYWKEAWLRPAVQGETVAQPDRDADWEQLEQLVLAGTVGKDSTPEEPVFRCQATQIAESGEMLSIWNVRSLLALVQNGDVRAAKLARVTSWLLVDKFLRRLGVLSRRPFRAAVIGVQTPAAVTPVAGGGFAPGDLVRVRSKNEIAKTLDANGKNRGLWFDWEMLPYCGQTARVKVKVERFISEPTGRMIELKSDCYILDGFWCTGELAFRKCFCFRNIYAWWRECWLERVEEPAALESPADHHSNGAHVENGSRVPDELAAPQRSSK